MMSIDNLWANVNPHFVIPIQAPTGRRHHDTSANLPARPRPRHDNNRTPDEHGPDNPQRHQPLNPRTRLASSPTKSPAWGNAS